MNKEPPDIKELTPAEQNPWYLLATWHHSDVFVDCSGANSINEKVEENRLFWHRLLLTYLTERNKHYFSTDKEKADFSRKLENFTEVQPFDIEEYEKIKVDFEKKLKENNSTYNKSLKNLLQSNETYEPNPIDFSNIIFSNSIKFNKYIFPFKTTFENSRFKGYVNFENIHFMEIANFISINVEAVWDFSNALFNKCAFFPRLISPPLAM